MSKAYDMNAKNIWVFNVGDLKHAEFEYQFAMDLAWNIDAWRPEKAHQYMKFWANETFGAELADDIAEVQQLHYIFLMRALPAMPPIKYPAHRIAARYGDDGKETADNEIGLRIHRNSEQREYDGSGCDRYPITDEDVGE